MKTINYFMIVVILSIATIVSSCSDSSDDNTNPTPNGIQTNEDLSIYLESLLDTKNIPGFSVNISLGNNIAYQKSFGYANIANQVPYTNQTLNNIASISKTFLGAATAKAIEQGYFTLETNINDLLPVNIVNPKQPNSEIKIKHLVTHTSGIVDVPSTYIARNYYILEGENISTGIANILMNQLGMQQMSQVALDEYLLEIFHEDGDLYNQENYLDAVSGSTWAYSNDATSLLGFIIEFLSEMSYDEYVANYVLTPLQMTNSTFNVAEVDFENMATFYYDLNSPFPRYANHGYVEGGLYSTSDDMSKYLLDMMKGARGESSTLFTQDFYNLLFTPRLQSRIVPTEFAENHGLFWYMKEGSLIHGGNSLGVSTHIELKQDGSSGFFIMTNMDGTFAENSANWEETKTLIFNAIKEYISNN